MRRARRTSSVVLAATGVAAVVGGFLVPGAGAESPFVNGSGKADARVMRVGPSAGRMALAPSIALALADYTGTVGRGEARPFEFGALNDSVPPEFTDQFPPTKTASIDEGSAAGVSEEYGPFTQHAWADSAPSGRSRIVFAGGGFPGFEASKGWAEASVGVVKDERARVAQGTAVIDEVRLGGGAVVLRGLRWTVMQKTGDAGTPPQVEGGFVLGSAVIEGEVFDGPMGGTELAQLFGPMNEALAPLGIALVEPRLEDAAGVGRLTPLRVQLTPSEVGRQVVAPALGAAQPARDAIFTPVLDQCADCASAVLVGDVVLGAIAGGGRLDVELGGVFAFTEGEQYDNLFLQSLGGTTPEAVGGEVPSVFVPRDDLPAEQARVKGALVTASAPTGAAASGRAPSGGQLAGRPARSTSPASGAWAASIIGLATVAAMVAAELRRARAAREDLAAS